MTIAVCAALFVISCKKDKEYTKYPYNNIERFALKGYANDTIKGVIIKDTVFVYWDASAKLPESITPSIIVSERATISPASGTAVSPASSPVYTVTAEDGTTRKYQLKFVLGQAPPIVTSIANADFLQWSGTTLMRITGQYFLTGGDTSAIRLYAQRVKDGFEFDMTLRRDLINSVTLSAGLPVYTAAMDTGRHNFKLVVGKQTINAGSGWIGAPLILGTYLSLENRPAKYYPGDVVTIKVDDGLNGAVYNWYRGKVSRIVLNLIKPPATNSTAQLQITDIEQVGNTLKFKMPDNAQNYADYYIGNTVVYYPKYNANGVPSTSTGFFNPSATDKLYIGALTPVKIAAWHFDALGGGVQPTVKQITADVGTGTLYFDGTNGSDNLTIGTNVVSYSGNILGDDRPSPVAFPNGSIVMAGPSANTKGMVFKVSTTGIRNLKVNFATRGEPTSFTTYKISYSTNGASFTDFKTITGMNVLDWSLQQLDFSAVTALNNAANVYIRITVDGNTMDSDPFGSNRFDNLIFSGVSN
jgi:hypothetical protein